MAADPNRVAVEQSDKQVVRFPGWTEPTGSQVAESREDARLLALIARGNQHALAALYQHRGGLLYSLLVRMLGSEVEAQEVMQDTFIQIWRRAETFDASRSAPMAWMIMIARGLAVDRLRSRSRRKATRDEYEKEVASLAIEEINGARQAERDELAAACATAVRGLPEAQARAVQLAFLRGWTHEEIASAEGEPLGTIKARIRRGLQALRKTLKEFHG